MEQIQKRKNFYFLVSGYFDWY